MEKWQILHLLLSLLLFDDYVFLKKYKSIFLNIVTLMYIVSIPFYCFITTSYEKFWSNFSILVLVLIMGLSAYYVIKLTIKKEWKNYPRFGFGFLLFFILYIVIGKVMP